MSPSLRSPVYLGIHARSIWRRHLKDKHKIPLSLQPRRTRWDGREDVDDKKDKGKKKASAKRCVSFLLPLFEAAG